MEQDRVASHVASRKRWVPSTENQLMFVEGLVWRTAVPFSLFIKEAIIDMSATLQE